MDSRNDPMALLFVKPCLFPVSSPENVDAILSALAEVVNDPAIISKNCAAAYHPRGIKGVAIKVTGAVQFYLEDYMFNMTMDMRKYPDRILNEKDTLTALTAQAKTLTQRVKDGVILRERQLKALDVIQSLTEFPASEFPENILDDIESIANKLGG